MMRPAPRLAHTREHRLRDAPDAEVVEVHGTLRRRDRRVLERPEVARARVIDQDVDPPVVPEHAAHTGIDRRLLDDVELADVELDALAPRSLTQRRRLGEIPHRRHDAKAGPGQDDCRC